mmetsp:Transcript_57642/g.123975  ORF Transcript_57642/g.123975 Transcript_57642/m.123975 type:complete len:377 (-) Transcript_57642:4-1134(-)
MVAQHPRQESSPPPAAKRLRGDQEADSLPDLEQRLETFRHWSDSSARAVEEQGTKLKEQREKLGLEVAAAKVDFSSAEERLREARASALEAEVRVSRLLGEATEQAEQAEAHLAGLADAAGREVKELQAVAKVATAAAAEALARPRGRGSCTEEGEEGEEGEVEEAETAKAQVAEAARAAAESRAKGLEEDLARLREEHSAALEAQKESEGRLVKRVAELKGELLEQQQQRAAAAAVADPPSGGPPLSLREPGAFLLARAAPRLQALAPSLGKVAGEYRVLQEAIHGRPAYAHREAAQAGCKAIFLYWSPERLGCWIFADCLPGDNTAAATEGPGSAHGVLARSLQAAWTALPEELASTRWATGDGATAEVRLARA